MDVKLGQGHGQRKGQGINYIEHLNQTMLELDMQNESKMKINGKQNSNNHFIATRSENTLSYLLSKIKGHFFKSPAPTIDPEVKLKATKINGDATKILSHLIDAKIKLKQHLDSETYGHLVKILDPLAEDVKKMNGLLQKATQTEEIASVLERYQQWMNKAKNWIGLGKESDRSDQVVRVIVEHWLGELSSSIDRDIRAILNYREQILSQLPEMAEETLSLLISPHVIALNALKERCIHAEIEEFADWKRWVNARRAVLFENALQVLENASTTK